MPANLENSSVAMGLEKVSFHFNPKERQCQKYSNYCTIALISHANKVMLKILQARLQQYMNHELPDVQAGFRKGRRTRDQIANILWIITKACIGEGNGHPLQYFFLENTRDRGTWWAAFYGVAQSQTRLKPLSSSSSSIYGCKNWTIKKVEHWRIDAFELWCWRRLLRVPWTAKRSNSPF